VFFYGIRIIGCTVIILHHCSGLSVHWTYRFCTTSVFQIIRVSSFSGVPFLYYVVAPAQFFAMHDVFHVSQLRKCLRDSDSILEPGVVEEIEVSPNLTYEQHPIRIIASEVKRLRNKDVPLVKVQWSSNPKDCSWESREYIERTHPDLLSRAL